MPTFYSRNVTTQASVADLARTTAELDPSGELNQLEQAFTEGAETGTLWETTILCHDDDTGMQFIGDYQSIPFHTVHAGKQFFSIQPEQSVDSESSEYKKQLTPPQKPHALAVTVFLSPRSFEVHPSCKLESSAQVNGSSCDIRIDAYYNGALLSSQTVARKFAGKKHQEKEQIVRITGLSDSGKKEEALVFVPPGQYPDGTLQTNKRNKETAAKRWNRISMMLDKEALELPTSSAAIADGLRSLAKLIMPSEIGRMHKGGRTYCFVDVVVTSGTLQDTAEPTVSTTREGAIPAVIGGAEFPLSNPMTTLADFSPGFSRKRSKGPGLSSRIPTSNMRPRYGYVLTIEPPQKTVEQQFQEIQTAAKSPTKDTAGDEWDFRKERFTRSKTPGLLINDFTSSPENQTTVKKRNEGMVKPTAVPEPTCPMSRHGSPALSITSSLSSAPSTPITIQSQQIQPKRKRENADDISVQRKKILTEGGCALTLSNRFRDIRERSGPGEYFNADTVLCINRFVFY